jgi:hypothetical protein
MATEKETKLMIVQYETCTESIRTNNPESDVKRIMAMAAGQVINIIYDGKIIYTRIER